VLSLIFAFLLVLSIVLLNIIPWVSIEVRGIRSPQCLHVTMARAAFIPQTAQDFQAIA